MYHFFLNQSLLKYLRPDNNNNKENPIDCNAGGHIINDDTKISEA